LYLLSFIHAARAQKLKRRGQIPRSHQPAQVHIRKCL